MDRSPNPTTWPIPVGLYPSDLWCQTASGCDPPFCHNALDRLTDRPTDRPRESLTTIGRCATRATRPNPMHVVYRFLPPPTTFSQHYNLRRRTRTLELREHSTYSDCNYFTRVLFLQCRVAHCPSLHCIYVSNVLRVFPLLCNSFYVRVFAIENPSVVCSVRVPHSGGWNFSAIFCCHFVSCILAILWPPCKILRRSSQGNPSVGNVKRKRGNKTERCHVRVSHLLMSFLSICCYWRTVGLLCL